MWTMWRVVNGIMLVMLPLIIISFIYDWYYEKPMGVSVLILSIIGCLEVMRDCVKIVKGEENANHS